MVESESREAEVTRVRRLLDDWKEVLVAVKRVLDWEQPFHPGLIFGVVTFYFFVLYWMEPSTTAHLSLSLLLLALADYLIPFIAPKLFPLDRWAKQEEHDMDVVCKTVVQVKYDVKDCCAGIMAFKSQRPRYYMAVSTMVLLTTAWLGSTFGDFFLAYVGMLFLLLIPGAKNTGIVDAYFGDIMTKIRETVLKQKGQ